MKKTPFLLLFMLFAKFSFANKIYLVSDTTYPLYYLQKGVHWVDSLKTIVRKGYPENSDRSKKNYKRQLSYVESAAALGLYYERLYDLKQFSSMKKAVYYYEKITDLGNTPSSEVEEDYKAEAISTTLCRKLADIYYKGKGIKKDHKKSAALALRGCTNKDFFLFYSKRYFGTTKTVLSDFRKYDFSKDTAFEIAVNPFFVKHYGYFLLKADAKALLTKVGNLYKEKFVNKGYNILITANAETSLRAQMIGHKSVESISEYLQHTIGIMADNITNEVQIEDEPVFVGNKSIKAYLITISFTE